jgi:uncharacterized protein (TIGR02145 family)
MNKNISFNTIFGLALLIVFIMSGCSGNDIDKTDTNIGNEQTDKNTGKYEGSSTIGDEDNKNSNAGKAGVNSQVGAITQDNNAKDITYNPWGASNNRYNNGRFIDSQYAYFWCASEYDSASAHDMDLDYFYKSPKLFSFDKRYGFSVRCLKD